MAEAKGLRAAAALGTRRAQTSVKAALADRQARRSGSADAAPDLLVPVFVRMLWGRVGSTLLMQLLATSDEIAFVRRYPFEKRQAAGLLAWAHSLRAPLPEPGDDWLTDTQLWWIDPAAFHVRVEGDPLYYGPGGASRTQLRRDAVKGLWRAFGDAARLAQPNARWYAEKYGGFAEELLDAGVPVRFLDLVRDPRDIWASVRSFDAQRGFYGFGRQPQQSEDDYLQSLATALARRFDAMRDTTSGAQRLVVRYEDLAGDLVGQASRIGAWLGVSLDPAAVSDDRESFRHHMTSPDLASSVSRWKNEIGDDQQALLATTLGPLADFGYDLEGQNQPRQPQ